MDLPPEHRVPHMCRFFVAHWYTPGRVGESACIWEGVAAVGNAPSPPAALRDGRRGCDLVWRAGRGACRCEKATARPIPGDPRRCAGVRCLCGLSRAACPCAGVRHVSGPEVHAGRLCPVWRPRRGRVRGVGRSCGSCSCYGLGRWIMACPAPSDTTSAMG